MTAFFTDPAVPGSLLPCLLAGSGMVLLAWILGRLTEGKCPFHSSTADDTSVANPRVSSALPPMDKTLRQSDPANTAFLQNLQGNILNGHGRDHAAHIFVRFAPGQSEKARKWIANFAHQHVRSAHDQYLAGLRFRSLGVDAGIFGHLALSSHGYDALGINKEQQPHGLNPRGHEDGKGYDEVFRKGLKARQKELHDPASSQWESAFQGEIHTLAILAADSEAQLDGALSEVLSGLEGIAELAHVERGLGLTRQLDPKDPSTVAHIEHFGFVDGRSQPLVLEEQIEQEKAKGGTDKWDPSAPLNLLLAPDPLGEPGSYGSFLVFRKLEQNVRGFHKGVQSLATALGAPVELARAMVMGRFQDGTPVTTDGKPGRTDVANNFNYGDDAEASKCPFQAHIRKANPRNAKGGDRRHRIARRGIPYGGDLVQSDKLDDLPESGRGLLFFCYQADIFEQFEFIQRTWSNFPNFPKPNVGLDTVIGQQDQNAPSQAAQNWPAGWGKPNVCPAVDIAGFVRMKGGEYFFSPSLSFLRSLG